MKDWNRRVDELFDELKLGIVTACRTQDAEACAEKAKYLERRAAAHLNLAMQRADEIQTHERPLQAEADKILRPFWQVCGEPTR